MPASRTVLVGGTVVDGSGAAARRADVVVEGERIVGVVAPGTASRSVVADAAATAAAADDAAAAFTEIDCTGRLILPGFIDAHSHADAAVFRPDVQLALLRQGITSVIAGQDGVSFAPGDGVYASEYFAAINGTHPHYAGDGVAGLLGGYDGTTPLNVGYLVPAGTVRHAVMGRSIAAPTPEQTDAMRALVETGLAEGALGLSTGLDYVPGIFASTTEIAALCEPVAEVGGLYVTHMRGGYEANARAGVEEVRSICELSGVEAHISHFHLPAADGAVLMAELRSDGFDVTYDAYPYTRGCTLLGMALLPASVSALPVDAIVDLLHDGESRTDLRRDWFPLIDEKPSLGPDWPSMITIAHAPHPSWEWMHGLTLADGATRLGVDPIDLALDLLADCRLEVSAVMAVRDQRSPADLAELLAHPAHLGGSDGIFVGSHLHPRAYGAFAAYVGVYTRERGAYTWEALASHLAGRTAERFGLGDRGRVEAGWIADLVVVDPGSASDRATYDHPLELAVGIDDVLVAGVPVLRDGELTGATPGRGLRRESGPGLRLGLRRETGVR